MKQNKWSNPLLLLLSIGIIFGSCNKKFSGDEPLPEEYKPSLYIGSDNRILYSFDAITLDKNWEYTASAPIQATPIIYKDFVIFIDNAGNMFKLNRITGKLIQKRSVGSGVVASPTYNDSLIFVATLDGRMIAYRGADIEADPLWVRSGLNPMVSGPRLMMVPDFTDNWAVFGANTNGEIFALKVSDGAQVWRRNIAPGFAFISSPSISPINIFIGATNGKIYNVRTMDGNTIWSYQTQGPITSSPISFGGNIMVGSADRNFYSIDSTYGSLRWKVLTDDKIESSPYFHNQYVYFGSNDMNLYCVDVLHGLLKWKKRTFSVVKSSPIVFNNSVFAGSYDKNMYVLGTDSGATIKLLDIKGQIQTSPIIDNINYVIYPTVSDKISRY